MYSRVEETQSRLEVVLEQRQTLLSWLTELVVDYYPRRY
jgi:hypothetical protein